MVRAEPEARRLVNNLVGRQEGPRGQVHPALRGTELLGTFGQTWHQESFSPEVTPQSLDCRGSAMGRSGFQLSPLMRLGKEWSVAISWFQSVVLNLTRIRDHYIQR